MAKPEIRRPRSDLLTPGQSRFNPIEHCWSPLSKLLTGVTLPIRLSKDASSPWEDNNLSNEERLKQKGEVLDYAIDSCKNKR